MGALLVKREEGKNEARLVRAFVVPVRKGFKKMVATQETIRYHATNSNWRENLMPMKSRKKTRWLPNNGSSRLEKRVDGLSRKIGLMRRESKREFKKVHLESAREFKKVRQESAREFKKVRQESAREFKKVRQESARERRFAKNRQGSLRRFAKNRQENPTSFVRK
ncbi:hypothetical protein HUU40_06505 [candidate division KSB1 bacterium]|nr:hypothetical protein [candidate division KSB1 bacterium]